MAALHIYTHETTIWYHSLLFQLQKLSLVARKLGG